MPGDSELDDALDSRTATKSPTVEVLNQHRDNVSHAPASSGATLLPRTVASLVSFVAQSTSLSLRLGTYFGGAALGGARVTTLTGLELSRAVIEGVLTRAGREVAGRGNSECSRLEAESLLERSVSASLSIRCFPRKLFTWCHHLSWLHCTRPLHPPHSSHLRVFIFPRSRCHQFQTFLRPFYQRLTRSWDQRSRHAPSRPLSPSSAESSRRMRRAKILIRWEWGTCSSDASGSRCCNAGEEETRRRRCAKVKGK